MSSKQLRIPSETDAIPKSFSREHMPLSHTACPAITALSQWELSQPLTKGAALTGFSYLHKKRKCYLCQFRVFKLLVVKGIPSPPSMLGLSSPSHILLYVYAQNN